MDKAKRKRLEAEGFRITTTEEFLGLSPEEIALIDLRLTLSAFLREQRQRAGLTQAELARRIGSSQSRIAKMEAGDPQVTLDLLIRALFACGVSVQGVGKLLGRVRAGEATTERRTSRQARAS